MGSLRKRTRVVYRHKLRGNIITIRLGYALGLTALVIAGAKLFADGQIGWLPSSALFAPALGFFLPLFTLLTLVWALVFRPIYNRQVRRSARQTKYETCPSCGYDCSANPGFTACPECGLTGDAERFREIWTNPKAR